MIAEDDGAGGDSFVELTIAQDADVRFHQDGELIEMAFRLDFLDQAEERVDDGHAADGDAALDLAEIKQSHRRRQYQEVEQGEQIAVQDLA